MRRLIAITSAVMLMLIALAAEAQVRGLGRLQGNVTDKSSGKPIAGATIVISLPNGHTEPITVKTDSKGHWAAIGMTSGVWNIDVSANGYVTSRGTANVSEIGSAPAINLQLEPQTAPQPAQQEVQAAPSVPKEAVDLIKEGQQLLNAKPGDVISVAQTDTAGTTTSVSHTVTQDELKDNAKKAVADLEKALPEVPDTTPELKEVRSQIMNVMAQGYYRAGDTPNAIAMLEKLDSVDPMPATPDQPHMTRDVLLANLYLENGQLDQGRALLDKLPPTAISDPTAYINIGILFLNKKNPADAATYFSKAIAMDPKRADTYYYRGLAEIQLKKNKEAKADLEQVVALAPDSSEAKDAKALLASLK
ncbi:MAG TPA: tetratricopeptide repeat protein [Thermoanaerobaculia bacterium]|nr:tetratricopeptide repeat protein [Thermoanaerobaculia bacterium]